jgi:hypothetical protein
MLGTPENELAGTMSFVSVTDAVVVAMEHWSVHHHAFSVETFFKIDSVVKAQEAFQYCSSWESSLLQYHTLMGRKLQNECFSIKKETTMQCAYSAIATER